MRTRALKAFSFALASRTNSARVASLTTGYKAVANRVVGMVQGGLGQAKQQDGLLAPHPAQVGQHLALHPALGASVDLVDQRHEQIDEGVGDLGRVRR